MDVFSPGPSSNVKAIFLPLGGTAQTTLTYNPELIVNEQIIKKLIHKTVRIIRQNQYDGNNSIKIPHPKNENKTRIRAIL
jgi:hypothetical protein